ncbi:hypothetical protein ABFS82_09G084800 [Erythranthe guttata]|uniref:Uncharacterized protein n=1 Tax=Erythranthe guttata TaxID=4155 RepID=A0A022Q3C8_ERYGU|nr:PREDICTED: uncharacterized protein LOC105975546 [Erythranthe guttata]EYU21733.1 hypothetical protein MIMGU_mgv1a024334mg [Erythranthe guttata]|eukprot:XP_012856196.1 PREDICTED: uncharacterized protein LOC105975546 [Erythranthe guttata]
MSGPPRVKLMTSAELEARPVLGPTGNKARSVELRKPMLKSKSEKAQRAQDVDDSKGKKSPTALQLPETKPEKIPSPVGFMKNGRSAASFFMQRSMSLNVSCSSDASSDSSHSRASTGRISWRSGTPTPPLKRNQQSSFKRERIEKIVGGEGEVVDGAAVVKKRCAWVTANTDPLYAAFHDEEWGLAVHDDKKLFELLSFSTALAELTWPVILSKRHLFREVFLDFDPNAVSKLNDKKIATPGSPASSLLSDLNLRAITENARRICKIIDEFGSFDKYIWGFVNHKPIVGNFRYPRLVPIKTSKADTISKDLVKRGFRGVGPTVVYSFMQVAGITNDHLISCFRHRDCITACDLSDKSNEGITTSKNEVKSLDNITEMELVRDINDVSLSR